MRRFNFGRRRAQRRIKAKQSVNQANSLIEEALQLYEAIGRYFPEDHIVAHLSCRTVRVIHYATGKTLVITVNQSGRYDPLEEREIGVQGAVTTHLLGVGLNELELMDLIDTWTGFEVLQ
jgi:hypothetical protein